MLERKTIPLDLKTINEEGVFTGYGSTFNNIDYWDDIVMPGAFKESLKKRMPKMFWNHSSNSPVGVYEEAYEDEKGLYLKGRLLLDIPKAKEAYVLMKNGAVDGLSIGFLTVDSGFEKRDDRTLRILKKVDLLEVSITPLPANPKALIGDVKGIETVRDVEELLRDAGFSRSDAKAAIAACKSALQRDAEEAEAIKAAKDLLQMFRSK